MVAVAVHLVVMVVAILRAVGFSKLKRHPVEVPSTVLWHKSIEDLHVNSIWQRLRNNLLLWLQLLLILLLAMALFRPNWQGTKLVGERFIFFLFFNR